MQLADLIDRRRDAFAPVFDPVLTRKNCIPIDLSSVNREFDGLAEAELDRAIEHKLAEAGALAAVGGYLEKREIYAATDVFQGDTARCIHIGVDVFMPAGTDVFPVLEGRVYCFANRQVRGDYGPVIILRHELEGIEFHSLYGHLTEASLQGLSNGKRIGAGEPLGQIGARPLNGNWPPHLHFQLVRRHAGLPGMTIRAWPPRWTCHSTGRIVPIRCRYSYRTPSPDYQGRMRSTSCNQRAATSSIASA